MRALLLFAVLSSLSHYSLANHYDADEADRPRPRAEFLFSHAEVKAFDEQKSQLKKDIEAYHAAAKKRGKQKDLLVTVTLRAAEQFLKPDGVDTKKLGEFRAKSFANHYGFEYGEYIASLGRDIDDKTKTLMDSKDNKRRKQSIKEFVQFCLDLYRLVAIFGKAEEESEGKTLADRRMDAAKALIEEYKKLDFVIKDPAFGKALNLGIQGNFAVTGYLPRLRSMMEKEDPKLVVEGMLEIRDNMWSARNAKVFPALK